MSVAVSMNTLSIEELLNIVRPRQFRPGEQLTMYLFG